MMEKILSMFTDQNGKISMMRLLVCFIVVVQMLTWAKLCIDEGNFIEFDWKQASTIIGPLFAKAYQAGNEKGE